MSSAREGREIPRAARALAIIPARLASQRLPRKMLLRAGDRALFAHTARNVIDSGAFARVIVATDSAEIADEARREGLESRLTNPAHASGSDRVAEVARALAELGEHPAVIVNIQGDEPELEQADLVRLVRAFDDASVEAATLAAPILDPAEAAQSSVVKVVCDRNGDALYFSRAAIPALGHAPASASGDAPSSATGRTFSTDQGLARSDGVEPSVLRRHVGVYAYRPDALQLFCTLPRGVLEERESLEQLRWLEAGRKMRVVAAVRAPRGIDTQDDFEQFAARVRGSASGGAARARSQSPEAIQVKAG